MNFSLPLVRLGLLAVTSGLILATGALHSRVERATAAVVASASPHTASSFSATTVHSSSPFVLPTVHATASEEERIAARIDPSDRIQIMSTITVLPDPADLLAANIASHAQNNATSDHDSNVDTVIDSAFGDAHHLRLDMPYYSFGKVLTRVQK